MRLRSLLLTLAVILLLAACAAPAAPAGAGPTKPSGERLTGTFNGNPALEGGCSWLDAGGTRYQLTLPRGYRVDYGQLTIVGPDGKPVAKAGDTIAVTGHKTKERLSFCQVGPLFDVETISAGS
ncbi:MAG: hypothetical protein ACRDYX_11000 [Egibacteraceae bacterium]